MSSRVEAEAPGPLTLDAPAVPEQLPRLRDMLETWLADGGCSVERIERLLLATNEAATNAIEHAYRDGPVGPLQLRAELVDDGAVRVTISDRGSWRRPRPGGPRGRGVLMMQECGDEVRIRRSSRGTTVVLSVRATRHPEPEVGSSIGSNGRFQVISRIDGDRVVAALTGDVPPESGVALRRELLAATCGGVVPLVLDVGAVERWSEGGVTAVTEVAEAAKAVGGRVAVVVPPASPANSAAAWRELTDAMEVVESIDHAPQPRSS